MSIRSALAELIPSHVSPLLRYRCDSDIVHFARGWTSPRSAKETKALTRNYFSSLGFLLQEPCLIRFDGTDGYLIYVVDAAQAVVPAPMGIVKG